MTAQEWLAALNDRVFFWLHPSRLDQLLLARRNRDKEHDVVTLATERLVAAYPHQVRLSAINSGATLYPGAPKRGRATFQTIEDHPFAERRKGRKLDAAVAELAVTGGVPDVLRYVVQVQRRRGPEVTAELYS